MSCSKPHCSKWGGAVLILLLASILVVSCHYETPPVEYLTFSFYGLAQDVNVLIDKLEDGKFDSSYAEAMATVEDLFGEGTTVAWYDAKGTEYKYGDEVSGSVTVYPRAADDDEYLVTQSSPYTFIIHSTAGLKEWNEAATTGENTSAYLSSNVILVANIELPSDGEDSNWTPVGSSSSPYTGTFDGSGHTISKLTINSSASYVGMFGCIGSEGTVKDLGLIEASISSSRSESYIGSIAGRNNGTIINCYNTGNVTGTGTANNIRVGGIAGWNYGTIIACFSTGYVSSTGTGSYNNAGGIAGNNSGAIIACYSSATVSNEGTWTCCVGGIVGNNYNNNAIIIACYSTGSAEGITNIGEGQGHIYVGGIAGNNGETIIACYSTATVSESGEYVGAITGGGSGSSDEAYEVTETITWKIATTAMNNALSDPSVVDDYGYRFEQTNENEPPALVKNN